MTILCLLQNQWFKNPERAQTVLKKYIDHKGDHGRNRFIKDMLFMGCLTGKRIKSAFGEDFCNNAIFEEVSTQIGGHASSVFPPDLQHVYQSLILHKPNIVIAFGKVAQSAISGVVEDEIAKKKIFLVFAPHPAARGDTVTQLQKTAQVVHKWMEK